MPGRKQNGVERRKEPNETTRNDADGAPEFRRIGPGNTHRVRISSDNSKELRDPGNSLPLVKA